MQYLEQKAVVFMFELLYLILLCIMIKLGSGLCEYDDYVLYNRGRIIFLQVW
jgi:hypothetical protein